MRRNPRRYAPTLAAAALALAGVAAACGDDDDTAIPQSGAADAGSAADETPEPAFPVDVESADGTVTIEAQPERIVSLSPTATEMLYAIDAGEQVAAVDSFSTHPEDAPVTDLQGFEPNVEAVTTYDPDLVVVGFVPDDVVAGLERVGIPVLEHPAPPSLDSAYDQMAQLGLATGHPEEAAQLVEDMEADMEDLATRAPARDEPLTYYHELDSQLFTATSQTFIGEIYALAGLENIADAADDGTGFPQLSPEYIIDADPDVIFLADEDGGVDAGVVAARPGWGEIDAVRDGDIVELNPEIASHWGPRTVDLLRTVVDAVGEVQDQ